MTNFSDYVVYVDESGHHELESIDKHYPIFVLAFCIFRKKDYHKIAAPALQALKFHQFGHDMVVLHERDIRKALGEFGFMRNEEARRQFNSELADVITRTPFQIIASVIDKRLLTKHQVHRYTDGYELALEFCLERLYYFLKRRRQVSKTTHVVFESRGKKEDNELRAAFGGVCMGENFSGRQMPFAIEVASKKVNSCGLQLADLVARPIGRHVLDPEKQNRAFDTLTEKFDRYRGKLYGYGLKVFPTK